MAATGELESRRARRAAICECNVTPHSGTKGNESTDATEASFRSPRKPYQRQRTTTVDLRLEPLGSHDALARKFAAALDARREVEVRIGGSVYYTRILRMEERRW